jgi:ABC-type dipeptide/oligopeptide/nickel transport system ATPase component
MIELVKHSPFPNQYEGNESQLEVDENLIDKIKIAASSLNTFKSLNLEIKERLTHLSMNTKQVCLEKSLSEILESTEKDFVAILTRCFDLFTDEDLIKMVKDKIEIKDLTIEKIMNPMASIPLKNETYIFSSSLQKELKQFVKFVFNIIHVIVSSFIKSFQIQELLNPVSGVFAAERLIDLALKILAIPMTNGFLNYFFPSFLKELVGWKKNVASVGIVSSIIAFGILYNRYFKPAPITLEKFVCYSSEEAKARFSPVLARESTIKEIAEAIKTDRHILITGESGVGKTALIQGLSLYMSNNKKLKNKKLFFTGQSGSFNGHQGGLNFFITQICPKIQGYENQYIFVFDEAHMLNSETRNSFKSLEKPQIILLTTKKEYEAHIQEDSAFAGRFAHFNIEPTNDEQLRTIVPSICHRKAPGIECSSQVVNKIIEISNSKEFKTIEPRSQPYRAVILTEQVITRMSLLREQIEAPLNTLKTKLNTKEINLTTIVPDTTSNINLYRTIDELKKEISQKEEEIKENLSKKARLEQLTKLKAQQIKLLHPLAHRFSKETNPVQQEKIKRQFIATHYFVIPILIKLIKNKIKELKGLGVSVEIDEDFIETVFQDNLKRKKVIREEEKQQ